MSRLGRLIGAVLVAGVATIAWQAMRANGPQPGTMVRPDPASPSDPPLGAPIVRVTLPGRLSPEAQMGKRAFEAKCAACHGANAAGRNGVAPPLVHRTYEPGHHSDMAFFMAVQNGVRAHHWPFGNMPPVGGMTRADVQAIVAYVRELQRANGIN
ncbi:MAG: hypothetical protein KatS3mg118_1274 [Paracoccaceae bacterium]|nr:MAG: hypothetical protein KatS3mg118_1274 [Paracoccaceae bacterium]